jgi:hypothetical protein
MADCRQSRFLLPFNPRIWYDFYKYHGETISRVK